MLEYLLFAGDHYYPEGGYKDFRGAFNTIEEAEKACLEKTRVPSEPPPPIVLFSRMSKLDEERAALLDREASAWEARVTWSEGPLKQKYSWCHIVRNNEIVKEW